MVDTRYGSFIYVHRTYIQQLIAHQLIPACTTGVGRAHISCYASVQQLLGGWQYRLRLIALIATLWHKTIRRELVKTHTLFKLFTKSAETPINTGGARGEELRTTLHHSSPLFTFGLRTELKWKLVLFGRGAETTFLCPTDFTDFP